VNRSSFAPPQAKFALAPADVLMVVRGFANEEHRMEETNKAIKHIAEWREKVILNVSKLCGEGAVTILGWAGWILRIL
jgi:hypothetical protein